MASSSNAPIRYTVGSIAGALFITSGVLLDIFDLVIGITGIGEVVDEMVDMVADIVLPMHAMAIGIPLGGKNGTQKMITLVGCEAVKVIPVVNLLPTYTYETWRLLQYSREEDRERAKARSASAANDSATMRMRARQYVRELEAARTANEDGEGEEAIAA